MSIKLTVDNNFFDNYECSPNDSEKDIVRNAFARRQFSFYPSLQLIEELVSLYETKRKHLLPKYSELFLNMMGHRCFNDWNIIIRTELGLINNESIFLNSSQTQKIKIMFDNLSKGRIHKDTKNALTEMATIKERRYSSAKEIRADHFKRMKELKVKTPRMSFDKFFSEDYVVRIRRDLIKDLFQKGGKDISEQKMDQIIDNSANYPYFYISQRIFMASFYRHNVLGRRVDKGDIYDQYYLIYLKNLDYLVSDDVGLKELSEDVFGKSKVITFSELIKLIRK